jgi:NAD(P)-dependent dehydrogenase (short-subunit alcohol dehydrogenase family)
MIDIYIQYCHQCSFILNPDYIICPDSIKQINLSNPQALFNIADMEIKGLTALITGATGQLGSEIAIALGRAGCNCICHFHGNASFATKLVRKIENLGSKAAAIKADLTEEGGLKKLFDTELGSPQILINSAAVFSPQPLTDATFENAGEILAINITAPIILSKLFVENLPGAEGEEITGKIINMVDVGAQRPWANYTVYCASKAGLLAATKSMAKELAPNICVNGIAPGVITLPRDSDPAKITGTIEEVTSVVLFLLDDDKITGRIINIDSGKGA